MKSRGQGITGEEEVLRLYAETLEKDPDYFSHYWENPATQVVAFGLGWEVAGSSEDAIWDFKLSLYQQEQPFCWVHPPEPDDDEDFFNLCNCNELHA
jgi:hypothetical protein